MTLEANWGGKIKKEMGKKLKMHSSKKIWSNTNKHYKVGKQHFRKCMVCEISEFNFKSVALET